jgi:pectinesterase
MGKKAISVSNINKADFSTIQSAIDVIPENNSELVTINVKSGNYREKLFINKPCISLIGENAATTIITNDDCAKKVFPNGELYGTFNSYTVFIGERDFFAANLTFENSAGDGDLVGQALAAYVDGDRAAFSHCRFLGNQDTLFLGPLPPKPLTATNFGGPRDGAERRNTRQYYHNCYISGDIDFIFGSATAVFHDCEIHSNDRNKNPNGYISAASTPKDVAHGFVFINCRLTSGAAAKSVYLGRPWREFAKTIFIDCRMGPHIEAEGWHDWETATWEKTVFYREYGSQGPGATIKERVPWSKVLTGAEAAEYTIPAILGGSDNWNPESGLP